MIWVDSTIKSGRLSLIERRSQVWLCGIFIRDSRANWLLISTIPERVGVYTCLHKLMNDDGETN